MDDSQLSDDLTHVLYTKDQLQDRIVELAAEIDRDKPVVTVCRSGARSAQAVVMLQKEGFRDIANLHGGMLRWRAEGYAAEDGH